MKDNWYVLDIIDDTGNKKEGKILCQAKLLYLDGHVDATWKEFWVPGILVVNGQAPGWYIRQIRADISEFPEGLEQHCIKAIIMGKEREQLLLTEAQMREQERQYRLLVSDDEVGQDGSGS